MAIIVDVANTDRYKLLAGDNALSVGDHTLEITTKENKAKM